MTIADIVTKIYDYTKTNSSSYPADNLIIDINQAYNRIVSLIMQADGRWQWDDDNRSDLPIATTTVTANQQDYSIAVSHLKLLRAEIKRNGATVWDKLVPIDEADEPLSLDNVNTGVPSYYDKIGNSVFLYPIPNYTQSASLKLYFQRGPDEYTGAQIWSSYLVGDSAATKAAYTLNGTKPPGFNSLYHDLIPLWVAYDYAISNGLSTASGFLNEILRKEEQLKRDYGKRDKDDRPIMTMKGISFR